MKSVKPGGRKYFRSWFTNMSFFLQRKVNRDVPPPCSPPHPPATDGQCVSPSSRFLTLNWSSWSVCSETMGESSLGDPGPGDEATRDWSGWALRGGLRGSESEGEAVCVCPIICVYAAFSEGTRWGLFTPLWVLETPCSQFLLSFVTNQVPFSPSLLSPFSFIFSSSSQCV